jgi:predicted permease
MSVLRNIVTGFRSLLRKKRVEGELDEELRGFFEMAADEKTKQGMSHKDALRQVRLERGNLEVAKEVVRAATWQSLLEMCWQDLRYCLRMMRRYPGFTAVAFLTLALGVGANTALFSVVNGVLLNPLPYEQPDRLIAINSRTAEIPRDSISYPNFLDWRRDNHSFSGLAAFCSQNFNLTGMGDAEQLKANRVSAAFFPLLGVKPILGRAFTEEEDQLGGAPVALISEGLWRSKFGSSPDALGKPITLDGTLYTIVGVIPASFHFENDSFFNNGEVYVPIGQWNHPIFRDRRASMGAAAVGRMKPGVTLQQAASDMDAVAAHLGEVYPDSDKNSGIVLLPLKENLVGDIRSFLLMLLTAVAFVLLIACANVANLLLARSTTRTREFALRTALGASPGRMVRQLLTESVLLALAGGTLGMLLAAWGTKAAIRALPEALPRAEEIHLDSRVLLFTLAASVIAGILFGLAPAIKSSRTDIQETLKETGRGGGARHRTQTIFVAAEMALALVLLAGAGLMIRSMANLWSMYPGFDPHNVVSFNLASAQPFGSTPSATQSAFRQLRAAISAVPGVQAASLTVASSPMGGNSSLPFWLEGEAKPATQAEMKPSYVYITQPDYLKVMNISLQRGRFLSDSDNENTPLVIAIDDQFAKLYFGDQDPVGKRVNFDVFNITVEIVGVVGHVKQTGLDSDTTDSIQAQCYLPLAQVPPSVLSLVERSSSAVVRTDGAPLAAMKSISNAVQKTNGQIVVYGTETMNDVISDSLAAKRFAMVLLGVFAALAMLLSSIGIYGVISYIVGERTHEIGIRMALGAERGNVIRMVLRQAGKMVLIGVVVGLVVAFGLSRLMASMLFGVSPSDPAILMGVALLLAGVSLLSCSLPALRATRVDPIIALRYE